MTCDT